MSILFYVVYCVLLIVQYNSRLLVERSIFVEFIIASPQSPIRMYIVHCTVGKIYTPIFSFFRKRVANIVFLELGSVSNERSGNSSFYRGIHEFLNPSFIEK